MNKVKNIVIIITVIVCLLTAAFFGTLYWMQSKAIAEERTKNTPQELKTISYELNEPIIVNIMSSNKMIRVKPILKIRNNTDEDTKFLAEIGISADGKCKSEGILRPPFYSVLRNKSLEEIEKPNSHEIIGKEIAKALNDSFNSDSFVNVDFSEFIYQ